MTPPIRSWRGGLPALALALALACAPFPRPAPEVPPVREAAPVQPVALVPPPEPVADPEPPPDPTLVMLDETLTAVATELSEEERHAVAAEIARAEREAGLPALLLVSLIQQESRFDKRAVGPRGARGLMQLRPFVAADIARRHELPYEGREVLFDPVRNIELGWLYLAELRDEFGTVALALAAYNKGPSRVRRDLRHGREPGRQFVARVLGRYDTYDQRFGLPPAPAALGPAAGQ